jgi:hypothetical protein
MSRQTWDETLAWAVASGTPITTSATETILFPNITIPANFLQDGRALRFWATGGWGTVVTNAKTLTIRMRWGGVSGTILAQTVAVALGTAAQGGGASRTAVWTLDGVIQTRSNGSSGTLFTGGLFTLNTAATPTLQTVADYGLSLALASGQTGGTTPVAVTVDLTADTALSLTAQWGTSDAANSIIGHMYTLEAMN